MRNPVRKLPGPVLTSVLLHAALVAGLFFVTGVVSRLSAMRTETVLRALASAPEVVAPEPPEVPAQLPEPLPDAADPEIRDDPLTEPPLFADETDPEDLHRDPRPPTDVPTSRIRNPIGIGGGAGTARRPSPPAPKPQAAPRPKGPTKKATAKHTPGPKYPRRAAERGYEGKVELLVEVLPDGKIGKIEVTKSSGYRILDDEAVRTVRTWVFTPAMIEGRPARSLVVVPFSFEFTGRR